MDSTSLPPDPNKPPRLTARQWLLVATLVLGLNLAAYWGMQVLFGPKPVPDVPMTDHHGHPFRYSAFRGRWLILYFGYTGCPEACPTGLSEMAKEVRALGTDARKVQVAMITLDPERDPTTKLAGYVPYFHPSFLGVHPSPSSLADIVKPFGVRYYRESTPGGGYEIAHSLRFYLLAPDGHLKTSFLTPMPTGSLRHALELD